MPRGKGIRRVPSFCRNCKREFQSCKEGSTTCSGRCRKAWNRLLGGSDAQRRGEVTDLPNANAVYRVLLNGRHVATKSTREEAEQMIEDWRREWDGTFTVQAAVPKQRGRKP